MINTKDVEEPCLLRKKGKHHQKYGSNKGHHNKTAKELYWQNYFNSYGCVINVVQLQYKLVQPKQNGYFIAVDLWSFFVFSEYEENYILRNIMFYRE